LIEFWLTFNNGSEKLRLPVPPKEFSISTGLQNTTVTIHELGEILLIGKRKLKSITLTSYFPIAEDGLNQYAGFPTASVCVDMISGWRDSGKPIRLLIVGDSLKINEAMAIESFTISQKSGPQEVYFTLELKEYRFLDKRDGNSSRSALALLRDYTGMPRPADREIPTTYAIQLGDSLWAVAKRFYGDGSRADEIVSKNSLSKSAEIPIGTVLLL
jgi:nucleoid-associated protein YgaU